MGITFDANGEFKYSASSVAEARQVLTEIRLKKKELQLAKRELTEKKREIGAEYTDYVRQRGSKIRGGGHLGEFIRAIQTAGRDSRRRSMARAIEPLEQQRERLDRLLLDLDEAGLKLETYIAKGP